MENVLGITCEALMWCFQVLIGSLMMDDGQRPSTLVQDDTALQQQWGYLCTLLAQTFHFNSCFILDFTEVNVVINLCGTSAQHRGEVWHYELNAQKSVLYVI